MTKALKSSVLALLLFTLAQFASAQSDYQVINVTNGGTISGTVKWSGPMPHLVSVPITKDPQICDPDNHKTRDLERLVVGADGGVANTVVYLKSIAAGKAMDLPPARRFLDQKHCRYVPHILLVPENAALQMESSDATLHTIHMDGAASYNLPFPFPNQVLTRDMNTPGLVNLRCNGGHTWMNGEMMVVKNPYYAVTDDSGKFVLKDVPAGQYELVAWHEGWKVLRQEGAFDVLTERKVERPVFSEPRTWDKPVEVKAGGTSVVDFTLSEK